MNAGTPVRIELPAAPSSPAHEELAAIFARAARRATELRLEYAGAVFPDEAWRLHSAALATIVDVRTRPEWELVGHVPGIALVEWRRYGEERPNPRFLEELAGHVSREEPVLFLCRSGARSHHAATLAERAGFRSAYNILEGFEGELDAQRRRGTRGGWRSAGLPWVQT